MKVPNRPVPTFNPERSLLLNDHFQLGYVTNNIDRAVAVFRERFGVTKFRENDADLPDGRQIRSRSAWIGSMMYEILCAAGRGFELYTDWVPGPEFQLRLHHFGYLVRDDASWLALEKQIAQGEWTLSQRGDHPNFVKTCYVHAPELGHYLEFILPRQEWVRRWEATPVA
jgi:hypothetical protein